MSADVRYLPDRMERQWRTFEAALQTALSNRGCASDEIDHALGALKPVFMQYARVHRIRNLRADSVDQALQDLSDWVSDFGTGLMLEIVYRELELYRAGLRA